MFSVPFRSGSRVVRCASRQAPNACVSHRMLCQAILKCHQRRPCVFDPSVESKAAEISGYVRMMLAKYRDVLKDARIREVVRARASPYITM